MGKGVITFILLVFGGGAVGTYFYFADPTGVDEENPLGKMAKLESYFATHKMKELNEKDYQAALVYALRDEKEKVGKKEVARVRVFASADEVDRRQNKEVIHVMLDAGGKVRALAGKFQTGREAAIGTVVGVMLQNAYVEISGGADPVFGAFELTNRMASFNNGKIEGKWYKLLSWDKSEEVFLFVK